MLSSFSRLSASPLLPSASLPQPTGHFSRKALSSHLYCTTSIAVLSPSLFGFVSGISFLLEAHRNTYVLPLESPWCGTLNTDGGCPVKPRAFLRRCSAEPRQAAGSPQTAQTGQGCLTGHGLASSVKGSLQRAQAKPGAFLCPVYVKRSSLNS